MKWVWNVEHCAGALPYIKCARLRGDHGVRNAAARPKVLVVDDEHFIASTLARILDQSGFCAVPIYCAWAAIQIAEGLQPDILITDISMPGLDGFEVASRVCARVPGCRVFFLSAQHPLERVREFQSKGHRFEFLHKPIHPSELLDRLRSGSQGADSPATTAQ